MHTILDRARIVQVLEDLDGPHRGSLRRQTLLRVLRKFVEAESGSSCPSPYNQ